MRFILCLLVLLVSSLELSAASVEESVDYKNKITATSDCKWSKSKVWVQKGDKFLVKQLAGGWTVDKKNYENVGLAGHLDELETGLRNHFSLKFHSDARFGQLLLSIGDDGETIPVEPGLITANRRGYIYLRINDTTPADNDGDLLVTIIKR